MFEVETTAVDKSMPIPKLWPWLSRVAFDWAVIVAAFAAAYHINHPLTWLAAVVVIGTRQHALGILGHDGAHRLACRHRLLNDALTGILCLWPLGIAISGYRRFHFKHHRTVGTDDDPELIHKRTFPQWKLPLRRWTLVRHIVSDFLGGSLPHIGMAMYLTRPTSFVDALGPALTFSIGTAVCLWFGAWWIPVVWFVSMGTAFWASFRLRLWTEHVGTTGTHRISATWWERFFFLPHNTWCHWEHHEHPSVPCWALPTLREVTIATRTASELFADLAKAAGVEPANEIRAA